MSGYACQFCDGQHPATFLQTNLVTGATLISCDEDLPMVVIGSLAEVIGVEMDGLYKAVKRYVDAEVKKAEKAAQTPATEQHRPGPKTRRARQRVADDGQGDPGETMDPPDPVEPDRGGQADDPDRLPPIPVSSKADS